MSEKITLTCALTGSIHTPTMSPHLPVTPDEIAEQALAAHQAGATILHLHARDPATGKPSAKTEDFMRFLPRIKQGCDAVLNISTGGSSQMTLDERLAAARAAQPEMCSLNMGSMNFGIFPLARRYETWRHDWEQPFLEATRDVVFKNTFGDIQTILADLGEGCGTRFEFECYDVGHIQTLAWFLRAGHVKPPVFVQFVLGVLGGIDASPESLMAMKGTADRLMGNAYRFSVLAAGRHQMPLGTMGAIIGGNVRVGLEDSLTDGNSRELARSNAAQVGRMRKIVETLGFEIATPDEARAILGLKGGDRVAF
ncbi:3-keto-5-aminohexanoate cleavage protein [Phyllobacterium phragmitis]|uniref:3-keto-5-aminohexanoate cleavage protein n=1 Tax=Phyllobacterium phragmitis TaxID=2670329 RepID=A0A2S9IWD6_9HYPH|nr:3-keto-5-aminohexanoate cleavage protein [Phyllobacterium phragmitis]PRD44839.1 3-keto-5-aminohexanoate cleavage protein [Phyllobacterium phragmitis]